MTVERLLLPALEVALLSAHPVHIVFDTNTHFLSFQLLYYNYIIMTVTLIFIDNCVYADTQTMRDRTHYHAAFVGGKMIQTVLHRFEYLSKL